METNPNLRPTRWMRAFYAALSCILIITVSTCGDDPTEPQVTVQVPEIHSINKTVVSPGDTLMITGQNFSTPASGNQVTFNNSVAVAVPYFATTTSMGVVVPEHAVTGPMTVKSGGDESAPVTIEVLRDVGDVWVMAGTGLTYNFKVPNPTGTARYLVVPHSATSTPLSFGYTVTPGTTSFYPSRLPGLPAGNGGTETFAHRFERSIREETIQYIERYGAGKRFAPQKVASQAPPDTTTFFVLNTVTGSTVSPSSYTTVTAALRYTGSHALIYSDTTNPAGGFDQTDYNNLGQQFDTQIHPTDVNAFGSETDIDGIGKVVILFTRVVNDLTPDGQAASGYIGGFFLLNDLAPGIVPSGTTNEMEIFYVLVPDPTGETGNVFPKSMVQTAAPQTIAHEFQHMISFGYRFVVLGGGSSVAYTQKLWLEEGMAHIAEDLNAMNSSNIKRANLYLADPGAVSLMGDDTLEQRGGIYLFLRYLGDHLGNTIYKSIVRSQCVGSACIEKVTGENFFFSAADYFAALFLSNNGAVPHDSKYDFTSINYPLDFDPLSVETRSVSQGQFNGVIRNAGADYYIIEGINTPAISLAVSVARYSAIRLVMVRIQ